MLKVVLLPEFLKFTKGAKKRVRELLKIQVCPRLKVLALVGNLEYTLRLFSRESIMLLLPMKLLTMTITAQVFR